MIKPLNSVERELWTCGLLILLLSLSVLAATGWPPSGVSLQLGETAWLVNLFDTLKGFHLFGLLPGGISLQVLNLLGTWGSGILALMALLLWHQRATEEAPPGQPLSGASVWVLAVSCTSASVWGDLVHPTGQLPWLLGLVALWLLLASWGETIRQDAKLRPPLSSQARLEFYVLRAYLRWARPLGITLTLGWLGWCGGVIGLLSGVCFLFGALDELFQWNQLLSRNAVNRLGIVIAVLLMVWFLVGSPALWAKHLVQAGVHLTVNHIQTAGWLSLLLQFSVSLLRDTFPWTPFFLMVGAAMLMEPIGGVISGRPGLTGNLKLSRKFTYYLNSGPRLWWRPPIWLLVSLVMLSLVAYLQNGVFPWLAIWFPLLLPRLAILLEDWVASAPQDHRNNPLESFQIITPGVLMGMAIVSVLLSTVFLSNDFQLSTFDAFSGLKQLPSSLANVIQVVNTGGWWKFKLMPPCLWFLVGGGWLWHIRSSSPRRQWLQVFLLWCGVWWVLWATCAHPVLTTYGTHLHGARQIPSVRGSALTITADAAPAFGAVAHLPLTDLPDSLTVSSQSHTTPLTNSLHPQWQLVSRVAFFNLSASDRLNWSLRQSFFYPNAPQWLRYLLNYPPSKSDAQRLQLTHQDQDHVWIPPQLTDALPPKAPTPAQPLDFPVNAETFYLIESKRND